MTSVWLVVQVLSWEDAFSLQPISFQPRPGSSISIGTGMEEPLATLKHGGCKAEIYETALPGQFSIRYFDATGIVICEEQLTGVSTYRQREDEINGRLKTLCEGGDPKSAQLADSGEY
jgi:hypothetical protein